MVTHYSLNGLDSACGRSSQTLVSTGVADAVSCKSCQRSLVKPDADAAVVRKSPSLAELRKSAKAASEPDFAVASVVLPASAPSVATPQVNPALASVLKQPVSSQPAPAASFNAKAAWAAQLVKQAGNRPPRGKQAKQRRG
ncbi:hypothetical protein [Pseudomonas shirazensis]|uniref:hypothetical protein n=1 Tax=Pseudomonas shirazensis TaxID=2745494 RepID=UPI001644E850|nr:hypothetical protein [Pseudomonas shirazensis]MBV4501705.1 hypothetical protein [Pseudomonas shirazensis]